MLSGNLPLIITGGEARGNVGKAEPNGKLDFFTELESGGMGDPYIDKPSAGHRSGEVLQTCRRVEGKLALMLRGISVCFLLLLPACEEDPTRLHLLSCSVVGGGGGELKGCRVNLFYSDDSLLFSSRARIKM